MKAFASRIMWCSQRDCASWGVVLPAFERRPLKEKWNSPSFFLSTAAVPIGVIARHLYQSPSIHSNFSLSIPATRVFPFFAATVGNVVVARVGPIAGDVLCKCLFRLFSCVEFIDRFKTFGSFTLNEMIHSCRPLQVRPSAIVR